MAARATVSRNLKQDSYIRDVWDGFVLQQMSVGDHFFSTPDHLALSLSTDGMPLFKSSPQSLWPVYLVVLNLPANIRMSCNNVILCGLWMGSTKPEMKMARIPRIIHWACTLVALACSLGCLPPAV